MDDIKEMEPVTRTSLILEISVVEKLTPNLEGVELNEGYTYRVEGSIPQLADGIAKMCVELDKLPDMGKNGGEMLLGLIIEYYKRTKES